MDEIDIATANARMRRSFGQISVEILLKTNMLKKMRECQQSMTSG